MMSRFYTFYHYLARVLFWLFTRRWIVRGLEHVPRTGPVIVIANHLSYSDPAAIIGSLPRQVYFMTKAEMFDGGMLDWIISQAEAFPVRRGSLDRAAIRHALGILARGDVLGMFPEGTRSHQAQLGSPHAGVVLIARQSKAPIVPIAITGMEHVFMRRRPWLGRPVVTVTYGEPFTIADLEAQLGPQASRDALAAAVIGRIADLLPHQYGGCLRRPPSSAEEPIHANSQPEHAH